MIKILSILNRVANIMKRSYDNHEFKMEIQDFEQYKNLNKEEIDQIFIEKASYIIKKNVEGEKKNKL